MAAELARRLYLQTGSTDVALERVELALDIAERHGLWEQFCEAINTKGMIVGGRGRHAESLALLECALQRSLQFKLHSAALRAYNNLAALCQEIDLERAYTLAHEGADLARLVGDRRSEITAMVGQVPILIDLGRWEEALEVESDFEATVAKSVAETDVPRELIYTVWVHLWRGDLVRARRAHGGCLPVEHTNVEYDDLSRAAEAALLRAEGRDGQALELMTAVIEGAGRSFDDVYIIRWVLAEGADAAFALGDTGAAEQLVSVVTGRFIAVYGPALDAQVSLVAARLAALDGRDADVAAYARDAVSLFDAMHMPFSGGGGADRARRMAGRPGPRRRGAGSSGTGGGDVHRARGNAVGRARGSRPNPRRLPARRDSTSRLSFAVNQKPSTPAPICASCGSPNREGRRASCGKCAAPLAKVCPSCGAANDADEKTLRGVRGAAR